ncbi:MAG: ABC transporter ATP-binding protein [Ornithinimicrobium sp.]
MTTRLEAVPRRVDIGIRRGTFDLRAAFELSPGTVTAVLGPNGSGKSTLLLALAGLLPLTSGSIDGATCWADASRGVHLATQDRRVGLVLADPLLFPHLSLADNVAFGPRSRGATKTAARERALAELDRLGLAAMADRKPEATSTGQAQRVALARALATDPSLLLLDEPLSALDPHTRSLTRADLHHRLRDFAGASVIVTHDPLDALTLADRLVFLEDGRVVQVDTPTAVIARPRSPYVARIVGLNLLSGTVRVDSQVVVDVPGGVVVTAEAPREFTDGREVWVTIDPAAVALYPTRAEGSPRNVWPVTVREVAIAGQRARIALDGPVPLTAEVTTAAVAELGLVVGREVYAGAKATEVVIYPA